jgi:hypothetical protein
VDSEAPLPNDDDSSRPTFAEVKRRLADYGCEEVATPAIGGPSGKLGPTIRNILNPKTGQSIVSEHWVDEERVSPSMCAHICRRLGIPEGDLRFDDGNGDCVSVRAPAGPTLQ